MIRCTHLLSQKIHEKQSIRHAKRSKKKLQKKTTSIVGKQLYLMFHMSFQVRISDKMLNCNSFKHASIKTIKNQMEEQNFYLCQSIKVM